MANILIVDDDEIIRDMLSQMMEREGHTPFTAENGQRATSLLSQTNFDLVITDIVMPEKEGLELINFMRKNYADLPIIAISGGARIGPESYLSVAQEFGAKFTFTKPIDMKDFLTAVRKCLERRRDPR